MSYGTQTQKETITAIGKSGTKYEFQVFPWGTSFNAVAAVYLVLKKQAGKYPVLYVGETEDLKERFENHHKQGCFDRNGKTHVGVLQEGIGTRRLRIEADLVANYNPPVTGN